MKRTPLRRKVGLKRGTKRLAKHRLDSIGKLKKQLWQLARAIIFKRHGNDCYTCKAKELTGSNRQCGHFIPSSVCSSALRFDLDNIRPQCSACNIWRSGNWIAFEAHLRADGFDVEELKRRNEQTKNRQYDRLWYQAKITEYEQLLNTL